MRITLARLAAVAQVAKVAKALSSKTPMADIVRPSNTALAKKYNYGLRVATPLDDLHGYMWWVIKNKMHDLWPLVGCFVFYGVFAGYVFWWQFQKTEVQLNRFSKYHPWDWERAQYVYDKRHKAFFNDSAMWKRIPELDKLQNEMMEVKHQRLAAEKAAHKGHH